MTGDRETGASENKRCGRLILLLGGARSGKSDLAERLAEKLSGGGAVLYLATAEARDDEMRARVVAHQSRRPARWSTLEEPLRVGPALRDHAGSARVVLLDCATVWTSNLLLAEMEGDAPAPAAEAKAMAAVDQLLAAHGEGGYHLIIVSNEVGLGLVPPYPLGRAYRDLLGRINQRLAARADEVYLMVAGLPLDLKALSAPLLETLFAGEDAE